MVAESYRGIRTSLQRALANDVKTIMFVSSYGGDGKSMVCANVSVALTQLFLEVILVDGDLRRPTLTNLFNSVEKPGLANYLTGDKTLDEVVHPTGIDRLRIVPSGGAMENPGDLLGRTSLATFCTGIGKMADAVILDTSPIAACNDAISVGQHIDTTIMVISPRRWDGDVEVKIRQTLEHHKVPLMGIVLNGSAALESYGVYGYGAATKSQYNYGYYGETTGQSPPAKRNRSFWQRLKGLFGPDF